MSGFDRLLKGILSRPGATAGLRTRPPQTEAERVQSFQLPEDPQQGSIIDCKLSNDLLAELFKHLSPRDLLRGPALVCQRWQRNSLQISVWSSKFCLPKPVKDLAHLEGAWAIPRLYKAVHSSNLLTEFSTHPSDRSAWLKGPGSDWRIENDGGIGMPHQNCPVELLPSEKIMASSYMLCSATQVVDLHAGLLKAGLKTETAKGVLDMGPALEFFVWVGQRFDCGAVGAISLGFGSTAQEAVKPPTPLFRGDLAEGSEVLVTEQHWNTQRVVHVTFKGVHGMWKGYACRIQAVPGGSRYVSVTLEGKDTQFWAGHYGMKFAKPCLTWGSGKQISNSRSCSKECFAMCFRPDGLSSQWL